MAVVDEQQVSALRREGRHEEAARLCVDAGAHARAAELFADVWKWELAVEQAIQADALSLAYRYALESEDRKLIAERRDALAGDADAARESALFAEDKGRLQDAAQLRQYAGDLLEAAGLHERAGNYAEAAALAERGGEDRRAGQLYERALKDRPDDAKSALRLAHILIKFGRFQQAASALQRVGEDAAERRLALRLLVACLAALRMDRAATDALAQLRALGEVLPRDVPAFLEETFGDRSGLVGLARGGDAGKLLAGRYRIVRPLGAGGSGRVLLGTDAFYDRQVAIKVLNVGGGKRGRDRYARFAREAEIAASLDHPNIVRVFEFNADGPFLVMEYMSGGTLEDRMMRMDIAAVRRTTFAILDGLEAVHRRGVIHRDLKPANVFFGAAGDVKLGDFGVAHLQDLESTLTGAMIGTIAYMTPEQITASRQPEAGTDLYALGVILYRLLTGSLPFDEEDLVEAHLRAAVVPPSTRRADLIGFDPLFARLLAKDLDARPADAEAVRSELLGLQWPEKAAEAAPSEVRISTPHISTARFAVLEARPDGSRLVEDTWLQRTARIEPADPAQCAFLRRAASADHPHLQAVYEVDDDASTAILEEPDGEPLSSAAIPADRVEAIQQELRSALDALHDVGVVHGDITPAMIRIGSGRAVLLLPPRPGEGSKIDDTEHLNAVFSDSAFALSAHRIDGVETKP